MRRLWGNGVQLGLVTTRTLLLLQQLMLMLLY